MTFALRSAKLSNPRRGNNRSRVGAFQPRSDHGQRGVDRKRREHEVIV